MIAFDTNILLYAADTRAKDKRAVAVDLLTTSKNVILLWQVAVEFIAASRKLEEFGLTGSEAWDQLKFYMSAQRLIIPTAAVLQNAEELHLLKKWSFWELRHPLGTNGKTEFVSALTIDNAKKLLAEKGILYNVDSELTFEGFQYTLRTES